jgi:hypothetical protein
VYFEAESKTLQVELGCMSKEEQDVLLHSKGHCIQGVMRGLS